MNVNSIPKTPIKYDVDLSGVKTNQVKVTMTLDMASDKPVDVQLPVVGPGAPDNAMNYAARLTRFGVADQDGNKVPFEKLSNGSWRIHQESMSSKGPVKVSYTINADEYDFIRAELNDQHAYMNGAQMFMFVKGHDRDIPAVVQLTNIPNKGWKAISTLRSVVGAKNTYYSPYFQDLADSNIEVGKFKQAKTFVNGTELTVAVHGAPPYQSLARHGVTAEQNLKDFSKIYATFQKEFGPFPAQRYYNAPEIPEGVDKTDRYTIIKHYLKSHGGATGLEHYHGHELQMESRRHAYRIHRDYNDDPRFYENEVMSHELGHKLDAKFVQHQGIDTSDFSKSQPTDGLWYTEGVTDWIAPFVLRRAGLISPQQYVGMIQTNMNQYRQDYFADPTNAREDSLDAQMGRSGYYNKGGLLGNMLDLEIRHRTGGEKSFADVIREVKSEFGGTGKYHTTEDLQNAAEKVAGSSLKEFFDDYLRGNKPIDFSHYLAYAGYRAAQKEDAWTPSSLSVGGAVLKSDNSGKLTLEAPKDGGKAKKEFPLTFLPGVGAYIEKKTDGGKSSLSVYLLRPDGAGFAAGLHEFGDKPMESLVLKVSVPSGAKHGGVKEMQVELSGKENGSLPDVLKALESDGKPVEVKAVGFKYKVDDNFRTGATKTKTVWVTPKPLKQDVIEELPEVTPEQKALRAQWLASPQSSQN